MADGLKFPGLHTSLPADRPAIHAIAAEARERLEKTVASLGEHERGWLGSTPLDHAATVVDSYRRRQPSSTMAVGTGELEGAVTAAGGEAWSITYRQLLLLHLLSGLPRRIPAWRIPELAWEGIERGLRLQFDPAGLSPEPSWEGAGFAKDLAAAQLRAFPFDGRVCEIGILHLRTDARTASQVERARLALYLRKSYFRPCWWISTHGWRNFRDHRRLDWRICEERVAAIIAVNPTIVGQASSGWINDPRLTEITPELAAQGNGYVAMGGQRFPAEWNEGTLRFALLTSARRRALFEAGEYRPKSYWIAQRRSDILRWARRYWREKAARPTT